MKLTFPDIGYAGAVAGAVFRDLGVDYIPALPPESDRKTELCPDAPEDMCMPFKLFLTGLDDAWKRGADTVVMISSGGPCRLGEFCELLKVILDRRGCRYRWIILDAPSSVGMKELLRRAGSLFPGLQKKNGIFRLIRTLHDARHLLKEVETFEADLRRNGGYYRDPKEVNRLISSCFEELSQAGGLSQAFDIMGKYRWKKTQLVPDFSRSPVKIALTGEIFTLNDARANRRIGDRLTELGVCFEKDITLSWWIRHTAAVSLRNILPCRRTAAESATVGSGNRGLREKIAGKIAGKRYLNCEIGGYTKESVAFAAAGKIRGMDGIIQIFPAGCMPEIVGHAILNRVSEREEIPVMTLIYDELSGEAGYITRIEAFADMLARKKRRPQNSADNA